uniref:NADH-ubiquinone oxidoreductase chain 5 n=1 Tax=Sphaeroma terebrans TaxID=180402 RepID=A0A5J6NHM0_SPHTE|nr:NADH dehydrogenase subunit 5 [Sphaeroma terebrans]
MSFRVYGSVVWSVLFLLMGGVSGGFSLAMMISGKSGLVEFCLYSAMGMFSFAMFMDWVSTLFFSFVAFISASVIFYSESYMAADKNKELFLKLVSMFVLSMFLMVFSLNLVSILLGWDGLGIVSYILVVYYQNDKSNSAGMITALSNRIGDVMILLGIGGMIEAGSWNFMLYPLETLSFKGWLIVFMIIAAMTKSAQMPFSAWLPAAMAAPTPVSALVHSSTLVTAGVYLMIRFNPLLINEGLGVYLGLIGGLTTFMASISANMETDLKKIVALSTLSQLGLMMSTLAMGFYKLAFFHLIVHAVFKALLFLCSGKIIHESGDTQDIRSMGGLLVSLPWTSVCLNLSNLALCGFPFLSGFYSKDLLIEASFMEDLSGLMLFLMVINVGLTAAYSMRLSLISMIQESNLSPLSASSEEDILMLSSKSGLAILAVVVGGSLAWLIFDSVSLTILTTKWKVMALSSVLVGGVLGLVMVSSEVIKLSSNKFNLSLQVLTQMWFLPLTTGDWVGGFGLKYSKKLKLWDFGWSEFLGGQGLYSIMSSGTAKVSSWQMSVVSLFMFIFLGMSVVMLLM